MKNVGVSATIELLKAGCLRGESIPLKVNITHNKPIKSLHGIIITLVRQGRFDTHNPMSSLSTKSSSTSLKKGLSLSSGGSVTTFRKDLSQVIMPLIVDPHTLTTTVRANIRVPEDAFPTISNVPRQMVSFRYYIEVLIDLGGKLAGKEEFLNGVGMVNIPGATSGEIGADGGKLGPGPVDASGMMAVYGAKVVETDRIRREIKNVVSCRFEVIVGTTDSASGMGRRRPNPAESGHQDQQQPYFGIHNNLSTTNTTSDRVFEELPVAQRHESQAPEYGVYEPDVLRSIVMQSSIGMEENHTPGADPVAISLSPCLASFDDHSAPPPPILELDDKERMRRAEQALLPSEPPVLSTMSNSGPSSIPSAPPLLNEPLYHHHHHHHYHQQHYPEYMLELPNLSHQHLHSPSAPAELFSIQPPMQSMPDYHSSPCSPISPQHQSIESEDKRELEHRRLLAAASTPPEASGSTDIRTTISSSSSTATIVPSAPFLPDDIGGYLPRYER